MNGRNQAALPQDDEGFPRVARILHAARNGHISISRQRALAPCSGALRARSKGRQAVLRRSRCVSRPLRGRPFIRRSASVAVLDTVPLSLWRLFHVSHPFVPSGLRVVFCGFWVSFSFINGMESGIMVLL